jgi:hypothetical protein
MDGYPAAGVQVKGNWTCVSSYSIDVNGFQRHFYLKRRVTAAIVGRAVTAKLRREI